MKKKIFNKKDIAQVVYNKIGYHKAVSKELVDSLFHIIKQNLILGRGVKIHGFGTFFLKDKKARKGRNPQTGKALTISARRILRFRISSLLKKQIISNK